MKRIILLFAAALVLIGLADANAYEHPAWKEDLRKVTEADGVIYSLYAGRTALVDDCEPGAEKVLEAYVHLLIPSQNLVEIQQWNIRQGGGEYRVQDLYDYALDTWGMVDQ